MSSLTTKDLCALPLTAVIYWQEDCYIASCPEIDVVTQGDTLDEAKAMLKEALELFLSAASRQEIERRLRGEPYVMPIQLAAAPVSAGADNGQNDETPIVVTVG